AATELVRVLARPALERAPKAARVREPELARDELDLGVPRAHPFLRAGPQEIFRDLLEGRARLAERPPERARARLKRARDFRERHAPRPVFCEDLAHLCRHSVHLTEARRRRRDGLL